MRSIVLCVSLLLISSISLASVKEPPKTMSDTTKECVKCHKKHSPGIVQQWGASKHYRANVGCYECHKADKGDKDAYIHDDKKVKKLISTIVSPRDCQNCHERQVKEAEASHHAKAGRIIGSLDNLLAEVVEGNRDMITDAFPQGNSASAVNGCWACHGSQVKVLEDGLLDPATWPNTGIGRINPDGSEGACTACHQRHEFSVAQARHPNTCGKCHLGPDHPQKEIYEESKHGIAFFSHEKDMNLGNPKWIPGEDFNLGPTCSTCHMGETNDQPSTHNVGLRISWNNRPVISIRPEKADAKMGLESANVNWEDRRDAMQDVCTACHEDNFVENFYFQYDSFIELYNKKFGKPGLELYKAAKPLLRPAKFSNKLDWIWFEIWHHEGRRARHGASMMAPDYAHWHGLYEVAQHFYVKMIPELEHLIDQGMHSKKRAKRKAAKALRAKLAQILNTDDHKWYDDKMDPKERAARKKAAAEFRARYGGK